MGTILCDIDPKVKVTDKKRVFAPSTAALAYLFSFYLFIYLYNI